MFTFNTVYDNDFLYMLRFTKVTIQDCEFNYNIVSAIMHIPVSNMEIPILVVDGKSSVHMDTHVHITGSKFQNNIATQSLLNLHVSNTEYNILIESSTEFSSNLCIQNVIYIEFPEENIINEGYKTVDIGERS